MSSAYLASMRGFWAASMRKLTPRAPTGRSFGSLAIAASWSIGFAPAGMAAGNVCAKKLGS
jgi:hypothetical protein